MADNVPVMDVAYVSFHADERRRLPVPITALASGDNVCRLPRTTRVIDHVAPGCLSGA
jgi:hypothetical protein